MKRHIVTAALLFFAANALADPEIKPGLWEHNFKLTSQSGQIEAAIEQAKQMMAAMPADQRKMVEDMMKSRGIDLDMGSYTAKVCLTQEQIDQNGLPKPNDNCEQTVTEKITDGYKVKYACAGDPPVSGEGEYTVIDDENFTIDVTVNTEINGQAETMDIKQSGKWISDACGTYAN